MIIQTTLIVINIIPVSYTHLIRVLHFIIFIANQFYFNMAPLEKQQQRQNIHKDRRFIQGMCRLFGKEDKVLPEKAAETTAAALSAFGKKNSL